MSCPLQKETVLLLPFRLGCFLYLFSCQFSLARISSITLSESGKSILVLFLILEEQFSVFEYDVSCGHVIYGNYYVEAHSLNKQFVDILLYSKNNNSEALLCVVLSHWFMFSYLIFPKILLGSLAFIDEETYMAYVCMTQSPCY